MSAAPAGNPTRALAVRALLYFALWIVVDQSARPANLLFGLLASAAATWASARLLPPAGDRVRLGQLLLLLPRFLWQSLLAGADVARRAFAAQPRLQPGFVDYPVGLPRGAGRSAFELIASLMPGRATGRRGACLRPGDATGAAGWLIFCSRRRPSSCSWSPAAWCAWRADQAAPSA